MAPQALRVKPESESTETAEACHDGPGNAMVMAVVAYVLCTVLISLIAAVS